MPPYFSVEVGYSYKSLNKILLIEFVHSSLLNSHSSMVTGIVKVILCLK